MNDTNGYDINTEEGIKLYLECLNANMDTYSISVFIDGKLTRISQNGDCSNKYK